MRHRKKETSESLTGSLALEYRVLEGFGFIPTEFESSTPYVYMYTTRAVPRVDEILIQKLRLQHSWGSRGWSKPESLQRRIVWPSGSKTQTQSTCHESWTYQVTASQHLLYWLLRSRTTASSEMISTHLDIVVKVYLSIYSYCWARWKYRYVYVVTGSVPKERYQGCRNGYQNWECGSIAMPNRSRKQFRST